MLGTLYDAGYNFKAFKFKPALSRFFFDNGVNPFSIETMEEAVKMNKKIRLEEHGLFDVWSGDSGSGSDS